MPARIKTVDEYFSARTTRLAWKIGDSILILGTSMSLISIDNMPQWVTYLSIILTLVGKVVTNFFTNAPKE